MPPTTEQRDSLQGHQQDAVQEQEYDFPYHYLVQSLNTGIKLTVSWPWGYKYLAGLDLIFGLIERRPFKSLVEVGCGDGRIISEIQKRHLECRFVGIDYSPRAIAFAKAFNPNVDFRVVDVTAESPKEVFDVVLLSEVLEHIHPKDIPDFMISLRDLMHQDSLLILTVPHINQPVIEKHFQHFSESSLQATLGEHFELAEVLHFDRHTRMLGWIQKIFFNSLYQVTNRRFQSWLYRKYRRSYFAANASNGRRLAALCKLKAE